jgi:oligopeptide/dipeptide ABC transporter ATP-binding protein
MSTATETGSDRIPRVEGAPLLQLDDLKMHFKTSGDGMLARGTKWVQAVDGVDLTVHAGETVGLVGESGCGKSTTAKLITRLLKPTHGRILYQGHDIAGLNERRMRPYRREIQLIFQDPYSSLNPRHTVGAIVGTALRTHGMVDKKGELRRVQELLEMVGLNPEHYNRYPHEFSGGQRQRIGIARALATQPQIIVADEPVSALDVSIQAQIINLLAGLSREMQLTLIFISHDLSVVKHISDRIAVMYLGKIVELGPATDVFEKPLHPYTKALVSAVAIPDPERERKRQRIILSGDPPSPLNPPPGCAFHPRCLHAVAECSRLTPQLEEFHDGREAACIRMREIN